MKKLLLFVCFIVIVGCNQTPVEFKLEPQVQVFADTNDYSLYTTCQKIDKLISYLRDPSAPIPDGNGNFSYRAFDVNLSYDLCSKRVFVIGDAHSTKVTAKGYSFLASQLLQKICHYSRRLCLHTDIVMEGIRVGMKRDGREVPSDDSTVMCHPIYEIGLEDSSRVKVYNSDYQKSGLWLKDETEIMQAFISIYGSNLTGTSVDAIINKHLFPSIEERQKFKASVSPDVYSRHFQYLKDVEDYYDDLIVSSFAKAKERHEDVELVVCYAGAMHALNCYYLHQMPVVMTTDYNEFLGLFLKGRLMR